MTDLPPAGPPGPYRAPGPHGQVPPAQPPQYQQPGQYQPAQQYQPAPQNQQPAQYQPPPNMPAGAGAAVRPPSRRGTSGGAVAALVAAVVIVGGVLATVLLTTSSANKPVAIAGAPAAARSSLPGGARLPSDASGLPGGASGLPGGAAGASAGGGGTGLLSADSLGTSYFEDLAQHLYSAPQALWCVPSQFPLTEADVGAVVAAYSEGAADPTASVTTVQGLVSLDDGRTGTVTISVQQQSDGSFCITGQRDDL